MYYERQKGTIMEKPINYQRFICPDCHDIFTSKEIPPDACGKRHCPVCLNDDFDPVTLRRLTKNDKEQ